MMLVVQQQAVNRVHNLDITKLAKEHYDRVFRFCSTRVGFHHAADATQETFITAQRNLAKFRGESQPLTWLIGIALNECRRVNRNLQRSEPLPEFSSEVSPETQLVDTQLLRHALSTLSAEHREVVTLHEIDGFTYEEIAQITDVPVGTVKSRLYHAFLNLRKVVFETQEVK